MGPIAAGRVTPRLLRLAYLLTFLTGAAGLVYQVAWQRYLARLLGSDSLATAAVLGVFLAGLSLGYVVCGWLTVRVGHLFRAYGLLEATIGIWALIFPLLFAAVEALAGGWFVDGPAARALQGLVYGGLLMGLPTLCMGGTVPMLTRGLAASVEQATPVHARVYALNTAGAFVGTLLAGYVLIWRFGLPATMRGAALLNLAAGVIFALGFPRLGTDDVAPGEAALETRRARPDRAAAKLAQTDRTTPAPVWLYAIVCLGGFYFMTLETLFVRLTRLALGSSSYAFALVVAACVLPIAVGAWWVGRQRSIRPTALLTNQLCIVVMLMALFLTLDKWPYWAHVLRIQFPSTTAGFVGFQLAVFVALLLLIGGPVACMGATLPLAFDALKGGLREVGRKAGALFAWNALGNLAGGVIGGFLVYRWFGNGEVFLCALGGAALAAVLATAWLGRRLRVRALAFGVAVAVFAALFPLHDPLRFAVGAFRYREPLMFSYEGVDTFYRELLKSRTMIAYRDDPEGTFAVVENLKPGEALAQRFPALAMSIYGNPETAPDAGPRPRSVLVNGKSDSSTYFDRETLKLLAHLPMLLGKRTERVLVVGLGTGVTVGELALYPEVRSMDVAEIAPAVVDFLPYFEPWTGGVQHDPRLRIHVGDAFQVIRRSHERWDVILSEPSNPWTVGVDQLFSREYYKLVREHLAEDGLLVQWIQRYAITEELSALVVNTLQTEFPFVRVFRAAGDDLMLASRWPIGEAALARASETLARNQAVRESLAEIEIKTVSDLLAREHPEVVERARSHKSLGVETLDRPRLHYLAGLAFFRGDQPD